MSVKELKGALEDMKTALEAYVESRTIHLKSMVAEVEQLATMAQHMDKERELAEKLNIENTEAHERLARLATTREKIKEYL
jgi:hypothetical protein